MISTSPLLSSGRPCGDHGNYLLERTTLVHVLGAIIISTTFFPLENCVVSNLKSLFASSHISRDGRGRQEEAGRAGAAQFLRLKTAIPKKP